MEKKKYSSPEINQEVLEIDDIIALSSGVLSTFDDSDEVFPGGSV